MEKGFLSRRIAHAGVTYPYQVYVPADYDPARRWPVVLFLHGAGERGEDGLLQTEIAIGSAIRCHPERFPGIVVMPQAPLDSFWGGPAGEAALAALDRTCEEFNSDPRRTYLTGLSMGGHGSWLLAYRNPERFAAALIICGFVGDRPNRPSLVPPGPGTPYQRMAEGVRHLPIWIVHGEVDRAVPVDESRAMAAALAEIGADVRYTELPGTDHDSWTPAYNSPSIIEWLFAQRR